MNITDYEREELRNLREQNVSDDIINELLNERRELIRWKEQQGIF